MGILHFYEHFNDGLIIFNHKQLKTIVGTVDVLKIVHACAWSLLPLC